jgi:hypothetical protein
MSFQFANLEIPTRTRKTVTKRGSKYPLAQIEIGGPALIIPLAEGDDIGKLQSRLASAVNTFRQTCKEAKFAVRAVEHEGQQVVAVWRLADRDMSAAADEHSDDVVETEVEDHNDEAAY